LESSCADLIRASTSLFRAAEGVDGRVKPGQDETREPISFLLPPQDFPRTALRFRGNDGNGGDWRLIDGVRCSFLPGFFLPDQVITARVTHLARVYCAVSVYLTVDDYFDAWRRPSSPRRGGVG
jgi:hypothetical protein